MMMAFCVQLRDRWALVSWMIDSCQLGVLSMPTARVSVAPPLAATAYLTSHMSSLHHNHQRFRRCIGLMLWLAQHVFTQVCMELIVNHQYYLVV